MLLVIRRTRNCLNLSKFVLTSVRFKGGQLETGTNKEVSNGVQNYIPVADFYNGKSVLVTGGTGFLGMALVEKLLYSCNGIEKLFLLVREKKGIPPDDRVKQFLNNPLFQRLKDDKPKSLSKLIPVSGDISAPDLGISSKDVRTLTEEVSVVFHSAANVRFAAKMSVPIKVNFEGTMKMLELSKKMKKIEMFVHISTAYANLTAHNQTLKEVLYPLPAPLEEIYEFIAKHDNDIEKTNKYLKGRINTYTLAKALAEYHIEKNREHVPVAIIRPAAVTAMAHSPEPGWLNDWQAMTRTMHDVSMGYNRVNPGRRANVIDQIPVDYVVNLSIVAAAKSRTDALLIYNCSTSAVNPITWSEAFKWFTEDVVKRGKNEFPFPYTVFVESKYLLWTMTALAQFLPAYILDVWLRLTGREPRYVPIQKRCMALRAGTEFFLRHNSMMENRNVMKMIRSLSEEDRRLFPCNPEDLDWRKYMHVYARGVEKFLLNENKK